jgi:hypothetical protein
MYRISLALFVVLATLAVGAPAGAGAPSLTPSQLVAKADAVCVRYAGRLASPGAQPRLGEATWDAGWLKAFDRQRAELVALRPPRSHAARYRAFLHTLPPLRDAFRALTAALEAKQPVRKWAPLVKRLQTAEQNAGRQARKVGLRRCFAAKQRDAETPSEPKPPKDPQDPTPPGEPGKGKGR